MKKSPKKLVLAKETVRHLEEPALGEIAGGATIITTCGALGCQIPCPK